MTGVGDIDVIAPGFGAKLGAIGIHSADELLERGAHTQDREQIAAQSGLTYPEVLESVNRADLARIPGISPDQTSLLRRAGVETVSDLAQRRADSLAAEMAAIGAAGVAAPGGRPPTEHEVADWIAQAKVLPRAVYHELHAEPGADPLPPPSPASGDETYVVAEPADAADEAVEPVVPLAAAAALGTAATTAPGGAAAAALTAGAIPAVDGAPIPIVHGPAATTAATAAWPEPWAVAADDTGGGTNWLWTVIALAALVLLAWLLWPRDGTTTTSPFPSATTLPGASPAAEPTPLATDTPGPAAAAPGPAVPE